MTTTESDAAGRIRETYEVYADGQRTVVRIADPQNGRAWIQSDRVQSIVQ
jgi:hypothetical protein